MRIVFVQDFLRVGGTERQTLFLCKFFIDQGIDCHLILFRPGGHLANLEQLKQIPHTVLQAFDSKLPLWAPRLIRKLKSLNPDGIICMGRTANCYAGRIQSKLPRSHVFGTLRTGKSLFFLQRLALPKVKSLIVNSNWWERQLVKRGIPSDRIFVAHNSLLLNRSEHERLEWRKDYRAKFSIPETTPLFLNVATFRSGKRHIDLLKAFLIIKTRYPHLPWKLWLVGDGKEYQKCKNWVAQKGLGTRIRFFHYQKDPFPFYAAADVAVSASQEDSLPNFLIEAQATHLPVIAFDCRGVVECCESEKTGIIVPAPDIEALAETIASFAQSSEKIKNFSSQASSFAAKKFAQIPQAELTLAFVKKRITIE